MVTILGPLSIALRFRPAYRFRPECEPVWPSGKALGWSAEGPRFDTASTLLSLQKGCGLWTLSCDFVPQKMALIAAHLSLSLIHI